MNTFSIITAMALGILITALVALLFLAIIYNVKAGTKYREILANKVQALRLNKMLSALGIDTYEYLHKESVVTIHEQINLCSECTNTDECDDNLSANTVDASTLEYCNNEATLKKMVPKKQGAN